MNMNAKRKIVLVSCLTALAFGGKGFAQTKDIKPAAVEPIKNSLSYVSQLEPLTYKYSAEHVQKLKLPAGTQYGISAESLKRVMPGAVKTESLMIPAGKNAFKTVNVGKVDLESLIPILVGSIKEQQAEIEKLKSEIQTLKSVAAIPANTNDTN